MCSSSEVLVTGALSFVGVHVLHELLTTAGKSTRTTTDLRACSAPGAPKYIHCLMDATDEASAMRALVAQFSGYKLDWEDRFGFRVKLVLGDVLKPRLLIAALKQLVHSVEQVWSERFSLRRTEQASCGCISPPSARALFRWTTLRGTCTCGLVLMSRSGVSSGQRAVCCRGCELRTIELASQDGAPLVVAVCLRGPAHGAQLRFGSRERAEQDKAARREDRHRSLYAYRIQL